MKRNTVTALILTLALSLALGACGGGGSYMESAAPAESSEAAPSASEAPAASAEGYTESETVPPPGAAEGLYPESEEQADGYGGESYLVIDENRATATEQQSVTTFSLKVDTAAYTNVQRYIESGSLPPRDAVRTEELINYFRYDGAMEFGGEPFAISTEVGPSPFSENKHMAFIRVKTREIDKAALPASNLTFLIDTSGSMNSYDKLPLLKEAFGLLVDTLDEDDRVSIVTYAGSSGIVLDSAAGSDREGILSAIRNLDAGGSTAGADGIRTAYALAEKNYVEGGNNRILLATDGDFNVGISDIDELARLVGEKKENGVYMSILGFGTGNIRDDIMETLSKNGSGNYAYINSAATARKVLVDELGTNLFTIADDVKAQIEFNPAAVKSYRLIGYENRRLSNEDFDDDTKDAGEVGVGTDVVMMFELELAGSGGEGLKYGDAAGEAAPAFADELFEVRIRYKDPGRSESKLITRPVTYGAISDTGSDDYRFACSVAAFGHLLRNSEYTGSATPGSTLALAKDSLGADREGYRQEQVHLLEKYADLL